MNEPNPSFGLPSQVGPKPDPEPAKPPRPLRLETYSRIGIRGRRHYWRVRHTSNGEIMASGEPYSRRIDRDRAVKVLWPDLTPVDVGAGH